MISSSSSRLLKTHEDLLQAVQVLRSHPDATKFQFYQLAFQESLRDAGGNAPSDSHVNLLSATTLVVKILTIVESSPLYHSSDRLKKGAHRIHWRDDIVFSKYLQDLFPINNHSILSYKHTESELLAEMKHELRATKLKQWHPVSPLRPKVKKATEKPGALRVLPIDPDVVNFQFSSIRTTGEETVAYVYLAGRLSDLYSELQSPRPRGWLERLVERKNGARYMIMATLIDVVFAVLLATTSLAVNSYQTWIAYQAWQHPVAVAG
ncbi:hypothetical protein B0H66DRAFT_640419 [Apodospora peruviana]|uniref:Uncharacterized protein n=1 Tax=Apodospora peruviana TaxID=516989 RepID=A0AAE0M4P0_9PEZI|nr:hypothetical protein B0H66DRAFT_640419 [Apodospora peruviana]